MSGPFVTVERNTDGEVFIGELVRTYDIEEDRLT